MRKQLFAIISAVFLVGLMSLTSPAHATDNGGETTTTTEKDHKVTICHREGNGSSHEIIVDRHAVPAHLMHGDSLGKCPTTTTTVKPTTTTVAPTTSTTKKHHDTTTTTSKPTTTTTEKSHESTTTTVKGSTTSTSQVVTTVKPSTTTTNQVVIVPQDSTTTTVKVESEIPRTGSSSNLILVGVGATLLIIGAIIMRLRTE